MPEEPDEQIREERSTGRLAVKVSAGVTVVVTIGAALVAAWSALHVAQESSKTQRETTDLQEVRVVLSRALDDIGVLSIRLGGRIAQWERGDPREASPEFRQARA